MYKDNHIHFTGSIPINKLVACIKSNKKLFAESKLTNEFISKSELDTFLSSIDSNSELAAELFQNLVCGSFRKNWKFNYLHFQKIYSFFQEILKLSHQPIFNFYEDGVDSILSNCISKKIHYAEILAGVKSDIHSTIERLRGMASAIDRNQNQISSRVRLTFIRNERGEFRNINKNLDLYNFLCLLESKNRLGRHIAGFDISGFENYSNKAITDLYAVLDQLKEFNYYLCSKMKKEMPVSIHFGENFQIDFKHSFYVLEKVLNKGVSKICHGTSLWINNYHVEEALNLNRIGLLRQLYKRKISFEICPSANLILTPLKNISDIKILSELGISFSINSDNITIFKTDAIKENGLANKEIWT